MARPSRVSADDIEQAAVTLVRERGIDALTARGVADALGVSTQPVYSSWGSMDALKARVAEKVEQQISAFLREPEPGVPPMLSVGMRTLRLAIEEPALFELAEGWMRATFHQAPPAALLRAMRADPRLATATDDELKRLNGMLWIFTQGLAAVVRPAHGDTDTPSELSRSAVLTLAEAREYLTAAGEAMVRDRARPG